VKVLLVSFVLLLSAMHVDARAEKTKCRYEEFGLGYVQVREGTKNWTYVVTLAGLNWQQWPYGYHAPGSLRCRFCRASGLYFFGSPPALYASDESDGDRRRPLTAAARVQRSREVYGYPYRRMTKTLVFESSREPISIGPLTGYAVYYKGLLVISVTDGCITFETALNRPADADWDMLQSLLKEISIERKPGAQTPSFPPGRVITSTWGGPSGETIRHKIWREK
jgi:hypothetical protein